MAKSELLIPCYFTVPAVPLATVVANWLQPNFPKKSAMTEEIIMLSILAKILLKKLLSSMFSMFLMMSQIFF